MKTTSEAYQARRMRLAEKWSEGQGGMLFSAPQVTRNADVHYPYRQHSHFYYLTGIAVPNVMLLLFKPASSSTLPKGQLIDVLIVPDFDATKQQWEGPTLTIEQAISVYGADHAYTWCTAQTALPPLLAGMQSLFCLPEQSSQATQQQAKWAITMGISPTLDTQIALLRLYKSDTEVAHMRNAATLTAHMHHTAMQSYWIGKTEQEIERALRAACLTAGGSELAYPSIVATGNNACILHHTPSERRVKAGELVLIDAGAEYGYYAADVTRTFPVSSTFTTAQKAVYHAVLSVQNTLIEQVRPGVTWQDLTRCFLHSLVEQLVILGLLKGEIATLLDKRAWFAFCPHSFGHWLGLDVHDVGAYQQNNQSQTLQPGMVFTVEPGIYIPTHHPAVPPEYQGIGVRIEDDVCVTKGGCTVLSQAIPKSVSAIEHLRHQANSAHNTE